jgi:hypothetical protein
VPRREVAAFHLVLGGSGVLELDGLDPLTLEAGDLVLLPRGDAHVVRDEPSSPVTMITELAPEKESSWEVHGGGSGAMTELLCGGFMLEDAHPLIASLPRVIRIAGRAGRPVEWLDASVQLLRGEMPVCCPGAEAVVTRVTDVLVAQAIRSFLARTGRRGIARCGPGRRADRCGGPARPRRSRPSLDGHRAGRAGRTLALGLLGAVSPAHRRVADALRHPLQARPSGGAAS